jgi:hypothetical protein
VWPAQLKESTLLVSLPIYLSGERGRVLLWGGLLADQIPECLRRQGQLVYYRPAHCYDMERHSGGPVPDQNGDKLRGECARVESQLVLQPLFLRSIAAKPDYFQEYSQERLRVGFFKVLAVNDAP